VFVISVIRDDREPAFEFAVLTQLLEGEAKCCQHCQKIFEQTSCLPMHCQSCDRHRGERWAFQLLQRARALARNSVYLAIEGNGR
jgi:hypothetical protein